MTSVGLNIGLQALLTSQSALDTIGHNLSNANTPGYSRQGLSISAAPTTMIRGLVQGTGVQADVVQRTVDDLLNKRLLKQTSVLGRFDSRLMGLQSAETLFGSGENSVQGNLRDLFGSFATLASDPADATLRSGAVQSAVGLAARFNQLSNGLQELGQDTVARMKAQVGQVNQLAQEVAELNHQISAVELGTKAASDLRDRRDLALRGLAQLMDTRVTENERGAVRVVVAGQTIVTPTEAEEVLLVTGPNGSLGELRLAGSDRPLDVTGGEIGGLLSVSEGFLPGLNEELQGFVHELILAANRAHSTGLPASGPFHQVVGSSLPLDLDDDGRVDDELLSQGGLPFQVTSGELYVNVSDEATGAMTKHKIAIDAERMTIAQFQAAVNAIDNVTASLDGQGRFRIQADAGYGFDFSARLDETPDDIGSLGGDRASLGSGSSGPFALTGGDTLDITGPSGAFTVAFNSGSFKQIGSATAAELAAAINADAGAQTNGILASAVGDDLVLHTAGSGPSTSFTVTGGSALGALGWTAGTAVSGHANAANAKVSGTYTGAKNDALTFRPNMDGTIGVTAGLALEVYDQQGLKVAEVDVGSGYRPGDELEVLHGVRVSFGLGQLSASHNDVMKLHVVADADSADVLPALGINSMFVGTNAATIGVRADLEHDPSLLATSATGARGDNGALHELLALFDGSVTNLDDRTLDEAFADIAGGVALDVSATDGARDAEQFLFESLESRRNEVSGVNVDEELVHLIEFEQAFAAASQFIRVISDLNQELLNII